MAETEGGSAPTEMNISTLDSSAPYVKDSSNPLTPSTVNTDMSVGGESDKDKAEADEVASSEGQTTPNEENPEVIETNDNQGTNDKYDDDSLPSDEAEEDVKSASFDAQDEEPPQTEELPFDEDVQTEEAETIGEAPATEEIAATEEEAVDESPPDAEEIAESTTEIDEVVDKEEDPAEESEEVAAQEQPEEAAVEEEKPDESPEEDVKESTETAPEARRPSPVQVQFDVPSDDEGSDDDRNEETPSSAAMVTPRSGGISFAQAFSTSPLPETMSPPLVLKSPRSTSNASAASSMSSGSFLESNTDTPTSHSALSATKNKRASGLISKYQEKVAHEAKPGDSVQLRSSSYKGYGVSNVSPGTSRIMQERSAQAFVELNSLPDMNSVRAKFEKSSRKSGGKFEFGETFRQKQRHEQLSEKQKAEEAKVNIRGFNEKILNGGKTATAEIDTSNLPKSFTFDMSTSTPLFPNDGVCRVDYTNADFRSKVFVVHKTRGMLLLQDKNFSITTSKSSGKKKKKRKSTVPGGKINEEEFLSAAKESGSPQVQLQIAAREAAARVVFETTGLDIRMQAGRLKPAVLCMTPSMNADRGYEYLRNENEENLYYFFQVEEDDFEKLQEEQGDGETPKLTRPSEDPGEDPAPAKLKRPSADPGDDPVPLKLSSDYHGFEFVQDPGKASKVLKKDGNDAAIALAMIMSAAKQEINGTADSEDGAIKEPDAKATEFANKSMLDDELDDEDESPPVDGTVRTVGTKEDEKGKPGEDGENKSMEDAAKEPKEDVAGKTAAGEAEAAAGEETKTVNEKTVFDDDVKIHLKNSSESMEDPVGVGCCCGFW